MQQPTVFDAVTFQWQKGGVLFIKIAYSKTIDDAFLSECRGYRPPSLWDRVFKGDTKIQYSTEMRDDEDNFSCDYDQWKYFNTSLFYSL